MFTPNGSVAFVTPRPGLPSTGASTEWNWVILAITNFAAMACGNCASMSGYRVYYAIAGAELVLLLLGSDKRTQSADIDQACAYWQDWQKREER